MMINNCLSLRHHRSSSKGSVRFSLIADRYLVRLVPEADIFAKGDELLGQAVQSKSNEQHPAGNVDVFFEH